VARFVAARLAHAIVVCFLVTTVAFFLLHAAPGDPFSFDNPRVSAEIRDLWRARFGYDRPLIEQYVRYLGNIATGQLGFSHSLHLPVSEAIATAIPRTLGLMGLALALSFPFGMWLGVFESQRRATTTAHVANGASLLMSSLPNFWVALMLLLTFSYWLPIFPAGGVVDVLMHDYMSPGRAFVDRLKHVALPLLALALVATAVIARFQRAALQDTMTADFVRTARAKGVPEAAVVGRHVLRNALLPMITIAGLTFPSLLGGALFVEKIFTWPGMGLLVTNAIGARDYPLVLASVQVGAFMVAAGSVLADVAYGIADPRIRVR
jgi:peptide/nickel transport system permease protein